MIKKAVRTVFHSLGLEIMRLKDTIPENLVKDTDSTMFAGLARTKKHGINPASVLDIGAAKGNWTKEALKIWPDANYCMAEPLEERRYALEILAAKNKRISVVSAAMGKEDGIVNFYVTRDLDGSGVEGIHSKDGESRTVKVTSADTIIVEKNLPAPYLLKLDTHGFEIPILEGAKNTLSKTTLLVIECYGIRIQPHALLFWEMCAWLDKQGFGLVDIVDIMRRPSDQAFWQCDAFFIKKNHPVFSRFNYH